jgi:acyl carrier protein phosphodiesterase
MGLRKHFETFPIEIQRGIILHRVIDTFADAHPVFRTSTKLHKRYHHYSGVIVDVFYDHFQVKANYSDENLLTIIYSALSNFGR